MIEAAMLAEHQPLISSGVSEGQRVDQKSRAMRVVSFRTRVAFPFTRRHNLRPYAPLAESARLDCQMDVCLTAHDTPVHGQHADSDCHLQLRKIDK
jgi:hypothetical protein